MWTKDKKRVQITSTGMLNSFGYEGLRTPAIVDLYEYELAILKAQGVDCVELNPKKIKDVPVIEIKKDVKKK